MTTTLYDLSVGSYTQVLKGTVNFLEKGLEYCEKNAINLVDIVDSALHEDMQSFYFQVMSINHHSAKAIEGLQAGEFAPPLYAFNHKAEQGDYEMLLATTKASIDLMKTQDPTTINATAGKTVTFKLGANEMPFTAENFVLSFSLPNFYFHATTAYDILRMKGVKLGKMDFLGKLRVGI